MTGISNQTRQNRRTQRTLVIFTPSTIDPSPPFLALLTKLERDLASAAAPISNLSFYSKVNEKIINTMKRSHSP